MSEKRTPCFVIMPFSETTDKHTEKYWTAHFEDFLKPAIEECGLEARRSEPLRGDILKQIITELVVCPIVIADMTDLNVNVFWELGVRQSFKHGTITIAEAGTKIPFDVGFKSTLYYHPKDYIKNEKFRKKFKKALKDCLSNPNRPDSHVLETISGRGTLYEIIHRDEALRRIKALISENKWNMAFNNSIYETIEKNQKNPKDWSHPTYRFRTPAIELLATDRYLDEGDAFYKIPEKVLTDFSMRNSALDDWKNKREIVESWFLRKKFREDFAKRLEDFGRLLDKIQKRLEIMC